jgi:hypothetical protein
LCKVGEIAGNKLTKKTHRNPKKKPMDDNNNLVQNFYRGRGSRAKANDAQRIYGRSELHTKYAAAVAADEEGERNEYDYIRLREQREFEKERLASMEDSLRHVPRIPYQFTEPKTHTIDRAEVEQLKRQQAKQQKELEDMRRKLLLAAAAASAPAPAPAAAAAPAPPPAAKDEVKQSDECVVCMAEKKTHLFLPCAHHCVCADCASIVCNGSKECPICRTPCEKSIRVY